MTIRRQLAWFGFVVVASIPSLGVAGNVEINGVPVTRTVATIDSTQDITEFREGGSPNVQLVPGIKRYGVCVMAQGPIAVLDAELPVSDTPSRFTVTVEDGRQFSRCLLASLERTTGKRPFAYCLRCEDVTTPAP